MQVVTFTCTHGTWEHASEGLRRGEARGKGGGSFKLWLGRRKAGKGKKILAQHHQGGGTVGTQSHSPVLNGQVDQRNADAFQLCGQRAVLLLEGHMELVREPRRVILVEQGTCSG